MRGLIKKTIRTTLCLGIALGLASTARPAEQADMGEMIYEVVLNEADSGPMLVLLQDERGALWIDADDLARLRLKPVSGQEMTHDGRHYWPLAEIPHLKLRIDSGRGRVYLQAPSEDFTATLLAAASRSELAIT
ncbi:MAG TPA: hypothetical protein VKG66_07265, partial [Steroidobacteraceae bacterium]|nr:hypothetical protein [Steroidobacteraceae bacterium]